MSAPGALSTRCARSPTRAGRRPRRLRSLWLAAQPAVSSVILGARSVEQLLDNMGAADLDLGEDALARLTEASTPRIDDYPMDLLAESSAAAPSAEGAEPGPAPSQGVVSTRWVGDTSIGGGSSRGVRPGVRVPRMLACRAPVALGSVAERPCQVRKPKTAKAIASLCPEAGRGCRP